MKKIFLPLLALLCLISPARAAGFYDLPADHWAGTEIQTTLDAGVVNGYGDGSFQPTREVTASQFCAMLARSFLKEEYDSAPEGKYREMDACRAVLEGTSVEKIWRDLGRRWDRYVYEPLSRYDMAQIVYNLSLQKEVFQETIHLSTEEIADWNEIPDGYLSAVFTCWGHGILKGRSDGRFAGEDTLNRAQACVIWSRLDEALNGPREIPADPDEDVEVKEMPAFGLQGDETVKEMMKRVNAGTPRCEKGRLPNGKSRTEENIRELLDLAREGCPDGTVWSKTTRYDYQPGRFSTVRGCLSFGLAVSDFVFGEETALTQYREIPTLSVGDVVHIRGGDVERSLIITGLDREGDLYTACELVEDGKVKWDSWGPISGLVDAMGFTTVYKRG